jgi:hypothetical protein
MSIDISAEDTGTVTAVWMQSDAAKDWVAVHLDLESWQWIGVNGFAIDSRFAASILAGMHEDGLIILI